MRVRERGLSHTHRTAERSYPRNQIHGLRAKAAADRDFPQHDRGPNGAVSASGYAQERC